MIEISHTDYYVIIVNGTLPDIIAQPAMFKGTSQAARDCAAYMKDIYTKPTDTVKIRRARVITVWDPGSTGKEASRAP